MADYWETDKGVRSFKTWEMTMALVAAKILRLGSYREIENVLEVAHSTLGDAIQCRSHGFFEDVCDHVLGLIKLKTNDRRIRKAINQVQAIDSTECSVHGSLFKDPNWIPKNTKSGKRSASIKLHAVWDVDGEWIEDFRIAPARRNDMPIARGFLIQPDKFYVFDRAYNAVEYWINIVDRGADFVTRLKFCNLTLEQRKRVLPEGDGILYDVEYIPSKPTLAQLPEKLRTQAKFRHIVYRDPKTKVVFDFVTSDFKTSAQIICDIYKKRWAVELLFRWLKGHLNIRRLAGKSKNGNKVLLAIAVLVQLLIRFKQISEKLTGTTWEILRGIRAAVMREGLARYGAPDDCRWSGRIGQGSSGLTS